MLRELSTVLLEMQESLAPFGDAASGVRLHDASLELPLDMRLVIADGGVRLDADVPRSLADLNWRDGASRLRLRIEAMPWPADDPGEAAP
jgi:hypothetical protein